MKYDISTKQGTALATMAGGKRCSRLAQRPHQHEQQQHLLLEHCTYELGGRPAGGSGSRSSASTPTGIATVVADRASLNGLALSPDEKLLSRHSDLGVWNINADGSPGTKTNMGAPNGDGIAMDCAGNIVNGTEVHGTKLRLRRHPNGETLIAVGGGTSVKLIQMTVPLPVALAACPRYSRPGCRRGRTTRTAHIITPISGASRYAQT